MGGITLAYRLADYSNASPGDKKLEGLSLAAETLSNTAWAGEKIAESMAIAIEKRICLKATECVLSTINAVSIIAQEFKNDKEKADGEKVIFSLASVGAVCKEYARLKNRSSSTQSLCQLEEASACFAKLPNGHEAARAFGQSIDLIKLGYRIIQESQTSPNKEISTEEATRNSQWIEAAHSISQGCFEAGRAVTKVIPSLPEKTGSILDVGSNAVSAAYGMYFTYQIEESFLGISSGSGKVENQCPMHSDPVSQLSSDVVPTSSIDQSIDSTFEMIALRLLEVMGWRSWTSIPDKLLNNSSLKLFTCPITLKPMRFAVKPKKAAGIYYDRDALQKWKAENLGKNPPRWPTQIGPCHEEEIEESQIAQSVINRFLSEICTSRLISFIGLSENNLSFRIAFRKLILKGFCPIEFESKAPEIQESLFKKLSEHIENIYALRLALPFHPFVKQLHTDLIKIQEQLISKDSKLKRS